jgi:tetratricopeptide (TPR) repeat protein
VQLLERYPKSDSLWARALAIYCWSLDAQGDMNSACIAAEQSLQLARTLSDKGVEAFSLLTLGGMLGLRGDLRKGVPLVEESLALYRSLGDRWGQAIATEWLCVNHNDLQQSKAYGMEGLRLHQELGNLSGIASCLSTAAQRAYWGGDFSSSAQWLEDARPIFRKLGDQAGEAELLHHFGNLAFWQSDYQQARAYYEESIALGEKIGYYVMVVWTPVHLAYLNLREGNISQAREVFYDSLRYMAKVKNVIGIVFSIEGLASLNVNQAQLERAARLFAWADATREKIGDQRPLVEQASMERDLAVIHAKLDDSDFAKLSAEGQAMSVEEAVELALKQ